MTSNEDLVAETREKLRLAEEKRVEGSFEAIDLWKGVALEYAPRLADALEATLTALDGAPEPEVFDVRYRHVEAHKKCCGGKGYCRECYEKWPCPTIGALGLTAEQEVNNDDY